MITEYSGTIIQIPHKYFFEKVLKCILLASKLLITMQIPHNFNKHVMVK